MKRITATVWAVGALCAATGWGISNAARAQDGPPPPQQGGPGGFGGGPQQGGGGRGGRGFGGGQAAPFAMGVITAVDANAGQVTIRSQQGGGTQTVQIASGTPLVAQTTVTVADLKVGDQVQVQGVPTGITASSLTIGEMPAGFGGGGPGGGGPGGFGGPGGGGPGGAPGGGNRAGGAAPAFASASGKVTSTEPLTISLSGDVSLTLKLARSAKITRIAPVEMSSLKVGDRITATGQANNDGGFNATNVGVNLEMGGGMMGRGGRGQGGGRGPGGGGFGGGPGGGFGGGPGGPPPGGPDGPPPPPNN